MDTNDTHKGDLIRVNSRQFVVENPLLRLTANEHYWTRIKGISFACIRVNSCQKAPILGMNREWTLVDTNWKEPIRVHARLFVVEDAGSVIDHEWTPMDINRGDLASALSCLFVLVFTYGKASIRA
jgi:hypothetical protein